MLNVDIDEIVTEMTLSEGRQGLSAAEKRELVQAVLECLRSKQDCDQQREKDTGLRNRAYRPEGSH